MLIPTHVGAGSTAVLAVPDPSYWCGTAAHFYVNPPGTSVTAGCVWGDASQPLGNWSPFVAGANQVAGGNTFVTAGINPIYCCEPANGFSQRDPGYGIRIECPGGGCNGLPCECNPSTMGVNKCSGGTVGAGGAEFCVVTVPAGGTANLVVFSTSNQSVVSTSQIVSDDTSSQASIVPPAPPSSSSSSSSSNSAVLPTSIGNATTYHRPQPSTTSEATEISIYPSGLGLGYNLGHPTNNLTTTTSLSAASVETVTPSPSTSGSDRMSSLSMSLSAILMLMGVVALGMFNL